QRRGLPRLLHPVLRVSLRPIGACRLHHFAPATCCALTTEGPMGTLAKVRSNGTSAGSSLEEACTVQRQYYSLRALLVAQRFRRRTEPTRSVMTRCSALRAPQRGTESSMRTTIDGSSNPTSPI